MVFFRTFSVVLRLRKNNASSFIFYSKLLFFIHPFQHVINMNDIN